MFPLQPVLRPPEPIRLRWGFQDGPDLRRSQGSAGEGPRTHSEINFTLVSVIILQDILSFQDVFPISPITSDQHWASEGQNLRLDFFWAPTVDMMAKVRAAFFLDDSIYSLFFPRW